MALPPTGRPKDEVLAELDDMRSGDVRWQEGRTFGMVYDAGPEAHEVLDAVATRFLHDNALNTMAFPSLGRIQSEVVGITADLLHGEGAAGFLTSGGTESILMAVKAARERGRTERGITAPEMVLPVSAHAAFHKAAHYLRHWRRLSLSARRESGERVTRNSSRIVSSIASRKLSRHRNLL